MDGNYSGISRRFGKLWHHLLHGGVHRGGCTHPSVTPKLPGSWGIAVCLVLFALTWGIPKAVYPLPYLAWLGFPGPGFVSGDYYPLIPFVFMYLTGFFTAQAAQASSLEAPAWAYANPIPALAVLGRHALPFYLLHQPVILGVLELVYSVR